MLVKIINKYTYYVQQIFDTLKIYCRALAPLVDSKLRRKSPGNKNKKLLVLSKLFPPKISGGTYRPAAFASFASKNGWRVTVVKEDTPIVDDAGVYLLGKLHEEILVCGYKGSKARGISWLTPSVDGGYDNVCEMYIAARRSISDNPPDAVFCSGPAFYSFVVGYYIKRKYGAKYILDFRDEWVFSPFEFISLGSSDQKWQGKCVAFADAIVFTTESQKDYFIAQYDEIDESKCHVVENGWDPEDYSSESAVRTDPEKITISYVGALGSHAPPTEFLDMLLDVGNRDPEFINSLQIRFVGNIYGDSLRAIQKCEKRLHISCVGHLPKKQVQVVMNESDVLVLFTPPDMRRYIPGKLYDYLASRKPVLVIGVEGEASSLVKRLGVGELFAPHQTKEMMSFLEKVKNDSLNEVDGEINEWLKNNTRERMAKKLLDIVDLN